jgi:hypothetical protein
MKRASAEEVNTGVEIGVEVVKVDRSRQGGREMTWEGYTPIMSLRVPCPRDVFQYGSRRYLSVTLAECGPKFEIYTTYMWL